LHQSLLGDLDEFLDRSDYDDDMTLVVLKWHGITAASTLQAQTAARRPAYSGRVTQEIQTD
jgi:hypothetical protein